MAQNENYISSHIIKIWIVCKYLVLVLSISNVTIFCVFCTIHRESILKFERKIF